jgi:hypothetical protein
MPPRPSAEVFYPPQCFLFLVEVVSLEAMIRMPKLKKGKYLDF